MKNYCKSFLFMSVMLAEKLFKTADVSTGVIDLESSIPDKQKDHARAMLIELLQKKYPFKFGLRVNSLRIADGLKDFLLLNEVAYLPDFIVLPLVDSAEEIQIARDLLHKMKKHCDIWTVVETPKGLVHINEIAKISSGIFFGAADFSAEMGVEITKDNLSYPRHVIVTTTAAFNIPAIDAPCFNLNSTDDLILECRLASNMGFFGKAAVHPNQITIINQLFKPTHEQVVWAENIIKILHESEKNIDKLNGMMIGPPFIRLARKILSDHRKP